MSDAPVFSDVLVPPTIERLRRGDVRRAERQVNDARGDIGDPFVTISLLVRLRNEGKLTSEEVEAGDRFHLEFRRAALGDLRAADVGRVRVENRRAGSEITVSAEHFRRRIWDALTVLGGLGAPPASCVYHVIGAEETLNDWARRRYTLRRISEHQAPGVLISALACLAVYYGRVKPATAAV